MINMGQKLIQVLNKLSLSSFDAIVAFVAYLLVLWSLYIHYEFSHLLPKFLFLGKVDLNSLIYIILRIGFHSAL